LSRRLFGERTHHLNERFPHWFAAAHRQYNHHEERCPVDQHQLFALLAPRPALATSATEDLWADPRGEYLSVWHAGPVYRLFGAPTVASAEPPAPGATAAGRVSHFLRPGPHDVTDADWQAYVAFVAGLAP
jgi:hypothetical protein